MSLGRGKVVPSPTSSPGWRKRARGISNVLDTLRTSTRRRWTHSQLNPEFSAVSLHVSHGEVGQLYICSTCDTGAFVARRMIQHQLPDNTMAWPSTADFSPSLQNTSASPAAAAAPADLQPFTSAPAQNQSIPLAASARKRKPSDGPSPDGDQQSASKQHPVKRACNQCRQQKVGSSWFMLLRNSS